MQFLALKIERAMNEECWKHLEAGKKQGTDSLLCLQKE